MMKNLKKSYNIFILVFALFVVLTVICTPLYGLGDLSEYISVFENVGIYNPSADTSCVTQTYGISENAKGPNSFFEGFLAAVVTLNRLVFSGTVFSIYFLSVIYCVLFLSAMYFLQKNMRFEKEYINYLFSSLLAVVFLDLGYLAYFNSFYSEAFVFVMIIAAISAAVSVSRKFSYFKLLLLTVCICLLAMLRFAAAVVALAFAVLLTIFSLNFQNKKKITCLILSAVVAVISIFSMFNATVPSRDVKLYNLVYNDLAKNTESDLSAIDMDYAYTQIDNPSLEDMKNAVEGITYGDVVKYYISNPSVFIKSIKSAANNAYFLVLDFASYREAGAYYGVRDVLHLRVWNFLKRTILPNGLAVILLFIVAFAAVAVKEYMKYIRSEDKKSAALALASVMLPIGAMSELIGTVLTTGQILISKNMFIFGVYFDFMIVVAVMWAVTTLIARRNSIKDKYGVNQ